MNNFIYKRSKVRLKRNFKSFLNLFIIMSFIFTLFYSLIFGAFWYKDFLLKDAGAEIQSEQLMILDSTKVNYNSGVQMTEIHNSNAVQENISQIDGVSAAYNTTYRMTSISLWSEEYIKQVYPMAEIQKEVGGFSIATIENGVSFVSQQLQYPSEVSDMYNPYGIKLVAGDYPYNGNEVLIPDILAELKCEGSYDACIGTTITLNTIPFDEETGTEKEYVVSGIYKTNYKLNYEQTYNIYTSYDYELHSDYVNGENFTPSTEEEVEKFKKNVVNFGSQEALDAVDPAVYTTPEAYDEHNGGHGTFIIVEPGMEEYVYDEVHNMYPYFKLYTVDSYKEIYGDELKLFYKILIIGLLFISFVSILIIKSLKNLFFKNIQQEIKTDFIFGFKRSEIITVELITSYIVVFISILIPLLLISALSSFLMLSMITVPVVLTSVILFLIVCSIETYIAVKKLTYKNTK